MWNDASKKDKIYATVILLQDRQIVHTVVFLFRSLFQNALTKKEDAEVYSRSNICRMVHKPRLTSMTTRTIIYKQADTAHFLIGDNIKHTQEHSAHFAAGGVCFLRAEIKRCKRCVSIGFSILERELRYKNK